MCCDKDGNCGKWDAMVSDGRAVNCGKCVATVQDGKAGNLGCEIAGKADNYGY